MPGGQWPEFKERFARLREAVRLMRQLWTQERVSFEGEFFRTVDAAVYDRPDVPVPVYVAAGGPVVARYAGRVADGFIGTGRAIARPALSAIHTGIYSNNLAWVVAGFVLVSALVLLR